MGQGVDSIDAKAVEWPLQAITGPAPSLDKTAPARLKETRECPGDGSRVDGDRAACAGGGEGVNSGQRPCNGLIGQRCVPVAEAGHRMG